MAGARPDRTSHPKIRFGPLVTPLFRRNPAKLALETITLDHLSKGRLIMGAGLGSDRFGEISTFGGQLDDKLRAEMLDEGLAILTGLWSGQPFSFEGKYHRLWNALAGSVLLSIAPHSDLDRGFMAEESSYAARRAL